MADGFDAVRSCPDHRMGIGLVKKKYRDRDAAVINSRIVGMVYVSVFRMIHQPGIDIRFRVRSGK